MLQLRVLSIRITKMGRGSFDMDHLWGAKDGTVGATFFLLASDLLHGITLQEARIIASTKWLSHAHTPDGGYELASSGAALLSILRLVHSH